MNQALIDTVSRELVDGIRATQIWGMLGWDDIRQRYRRSVLGPFWITLSMGVLIFMLGVIYARLFNIDIATYLPFLSIGYILWGFISSTTNESCRAFQEGERILKQLKLPYAVYVLRVVWRNFIVFLHTIVIYVPVAIIFQVAPDRYSLLALPGLALVYLNQTWVAFVVAILATRYRDVQQVVMTAVNILLFATPIMWPATSLGDAQYIALVNPLYHLVEIVRAPLLGLAPSALSWAVAIVMAVVGWLIAVALFARASRRIVFWV